MKKQRIFFTGFITLIILFFCHSLGAIGSVTVTFKSLKQYQQLCFKGLGKIHCMVKQIHPRQVLLLFNQRVVIKKGQNFPNFIAISPTKDNIKQFTVNFGKPYNVAEFHKDGSLYLDLYPEQKLGLLKSVIPDSSENSINKGIKNPSESKTEIKKKSESIPVIPNGLSIRKSTTEEGLILENSILFPLASFTQGKYVYILWPSTIAVCSGTLPLIPGVNKIEWLKKEGKTIGILLTIKPYFQFNVFKEKEQWVLSLKKNLPKENYNWTLSKDKKGYSSCIIEDVQGKEIEDFIDPLTGEAFKIAYSNNDHRKLDFPIETIEMKILPSLIGIICQPYQKDLHIQFQSKDIILSTSLGLTVSTEEERYRNIPSNTENFFKFSSLKEEKKSWTEKRNFLISILNQSELEQSLQKHFDLIRFYLSTGFSEEAFSFLQKVIQKDPLQRERETYLGLLGITQVLRGHYEEALTILKDSRFAEEKEIALWIALTQLSLGQNICNPYIFDENLIFIRNYPVFIKMKFVFAVGLYLLKNQKLDQAKKLLSLINKEEFETGIPEELQYLQSLIMYKEGKKDAAINIWQQLGKNFKTRIGVEANLMLLDHQISLGLLGSDEVIKQLKSLRYRWRDDEIELRIVNKLIEYYLKQKQYRLALTEMQYLENNFPTLIDTQEIHRQIQEQLIKLYTIPNENFPLLSLLSIYNDYKSYLPKDDRMKDIRTSLAEKLFEIGLTDQGLTILTDQLKESSLTDKPILGAKMAEIYLRNDNPTAVLKILEETSNDTVSAEVLANRQLIEAQSLSLIQKYDEALSIIQHRTDKKAILLKRDILLTANRWVEAGEILEEFLEKEDIGKSPLSDYQSQLILDLAVTAALSKKFPLLNNLRLRYLNLMQQTDVGVLFEVVTKKPESPQDINELTIINSLEKAEKFEVLLQAYKARLRKSLD